MKINPNTGGKTSSMQTNTIADREIELKGSLSRATKQWTYW